MKKTFTIKPAENNVKISSTGKENTNLLNFLKPDVCCEWAVTIVGNVTAQKSLILR